MPDEKKGGAATTESGATGTKVTEESKVGSGEAVKSPAQMEQERSAAIAKATETPDEGGTASETQTEEEKKQQLRAVAPTPATASGAEKLRLTGEAEIPKGKDRGSQTEVVGGKEIKSDYPKGPTNKPVGAQAEPSPFAPNGSLEPNMMPSPSGPIPAGAAGSFAMNPALLTSARQRQGLRSGSYDQLTDEQIETTDVNILRQVAVDRGYTSVDRQQRGARALRAQFRAAQEKDESLKERLKKADEDKE